MKRLKNAFHSCFINVTVYAWHFHLLKMPDQYMKSGQRIQPIAAGDLEWAGFRCSSRAAWAVTHQYLCSGKSAFSLIFPVVYCKIIQRFRQKAFAGCVRERLSLACGYTMGKRRREALTERRSFLFIVQNIRAGTVRINACGVSRLERRRSRKPIVIICGQFTNT